MRGLKRKTCEPASSRLAPFFPPVVRRTAADTFFRGPILQRQESSEEEKKDPITEGLAVTAEQLGKHEPFKKWYEPKLDRLKLTLWDKASPAEKVAMLTFLGMNLGMGATAFALDPKIRTALSGVNIGKPLGLIPYSPLEGFTYTLPGAGKSAYGFSADFTLNPYLEALRKRHPGFPLSGATFGLESSYDPSGKGFSLTGGKVGLDFFDGALKAEGKTFKDLSPYPLLQPGGTWMMEQVPGMPKIGGPGYQFTINADLLKLFSGLKPVF